MSNSCQHLAAVASQIFAMVIMDCIARKGDICQPVPPLDGALGIPPQVTANFPQKACCGTIVVGYTTNDMLSGHCRIFGQNRLEMCYRIP